MGKQAVDPVAGAPYSSGLVAGDFVFVSGQIGRDPDTGAMGESVREQTEVTIANIRRVLAKGGLGLEDVVKALVFLTDMGTFAEMNATYCEAFPEPRPTRSTIGVNGLASPEIKVEIEVIALARK